MQTEEINGSITIKKAEIPINTKNSRAKLVIA